MFTDTDKKVDTYRKNLLRNSIDPKKITVDELKAVAPDYTQGLPDEQLQRLMHILTNYDLAQENLQAKNVQGVAAKDIIQNTFAPGITSFPHIQEITQAIIKHNKKIDEQKRSITGKNITETGDMLKEDLLVEDPDTGTITKHSANAYKYLSETLAGNDADAAAFLSKKNEKLSEQATLQQVYEVAQANSIKMRQMHDKLVSDKAELEKRKDALKAKIRLAKAQEDVNRISSKTNSL